MKKFTALLTSVALFVSTLGISAFNINTVTVHADTSWPDAPSIYGTSGCLIEASTGTVLYEKKAYQQMYPASITKILTALVTLENAELDEMVTFSEEAVYSLVAGDANMAMSVGEILSVEDCLYGLMLKSANEVATALAEHVGGSVEGFAEMMNQRAKEASALNSNFMNANGLHDDNHYITAYDMAMITRAAIQNPVYVSITGTTEYTVSKSNMKDAFTIYQRHQMTRQSTGYYYEGILGGKTGYTDQSGTTLVTYAERNGMTLVAVVLQSNGVNVYNDTATLLDYGFENFNLVNVADNESRFNAVSDNYTDYLTPVFGTTSNSSIQINEDDYVVLPKDATFADVTSTITYTGATTGDDSEISSDNNLNKVAQITYNYGERSVGTASVVYASNTGSEDSVLANATVSDKSSSDKNTDTKDKDQYKHKAKDTNKEKNKNNKSVIKTIVTVLLNLLVLFIIILLIRKKQKQLNEIRARKRRRNYY